jgi:Asp/Glu/hydantoin racemase
MAATLGILMLDTAFERHPGDIGNPASFTFPVRYARVAGASARAITQLSDDRFLEPFTLAAYDLVARGVDGIITSCGFLALYQPALAARLPVPIATSALLQVAWVARLIPPTQRVGVITFDADSLQSMHLAAAGAPPDTPVIGLATDGCFRRAVLGDAAADSYSARESEAVAAAEHLLQQYPDIGAIVLECTNLVPHAAAMQAAVRRPIFDVITLANWFHAGLASRRWPAR